jgi:hypothetical protein
MNREIQAAQWMADHGARRVDHDPYDFAPGTDELPPQLRKGELEGYNPWSHGTDNTVIGRDVDPNAHPLYRTGTRPLDQVIQDGGIVPRSPGKVGWENMDGHVGGNTNSGFTSSTSDIVHAAERLRDSENSVSWIYKHHTPGGIDVDATYRYHGQTWGHAEAEILHPGIRLEDIAGAWKRTRASEWVMDSAGRWAERTSYNFEWHQNPHFVRRP